MKPKPPPPGCPWALFLDFDGTLVELAAHPDHVEVNERLREVLARLRRLQAGALALVSGRSIASLDGLLAPMTLPLAGVHGLERRDARGHIHRPAGAVDRLAALRRTLDGFIAERPGLFYEDKHLALAVHYRAAPQHAGELERFLRRALHELGNGFQLQTGKAVFEVRPAGADKGSAVRAFMAEPPFAGRLPVFAGDDRTDEDAFAAVNALGGISVRVGDGRPTAARYELADVEETLAWLSQTPKH
ncbi:trehalose-phosphatase [Ectothiorhodospiraceae bacterium WFHF3C12]|nr:trehalose-phosphatase [Ectothiorhodospiraceae bacterium WFHF3C12]